jgi:uroporphyrinogen decarboxylase
MGTDADRPSAETDLAFLSIAAEELGMTERERMIAVLNHQPPDKVPWSIGLTEPAQLQLADYLGREDLKDRQVFNEWVGNHGRGVGPRNRRGLHMLEEEVEPGLWRDSFGVIWNTIGLYGEGGWGRPVNCVLPEPTLKGYSFPDPPKPEDFAHYPQFIEENRDHFISGGGGHLFEAAWAMRGMENFLTDLILHPEFVHELMEAISDYYLAFIHEAIKYDVDSCGFGDDWGSQDRGLIMGPTHWRTYIKPYMAKMFAPIKEAGKYVRLHSDGDVTAIFDDLIEIGLDIYTPYQPEIMDVYEIKKQYGDRLCFHGGIGVQSLLPFGTPAEVRAEARRLIEEVGADGGFVLAPSHSVLADVPAENVMALIETVHSQ